LLLLLLLLMRSFNFFQICKYYDTPEANDIGRKKWTVERKRSFTPRDFGYVLVPRGLFCYNVIHLFQNFNQRLLLIAGVQHRSLLTG